MAHLVITIGCEYGAKGNQIGKKVAQDLGIKFYDRETVDEIIKEVGIPKDIMEKVEEGVTIAGKGAEGDVRGSFSKYADLTERAIHVQKTIIRKLAARESCVIIGRSADYILKEQKPILRIFIYAPDEIRIKNVMESHNLSADDAKLLIVEKDKRYHKRHMALTGSNRGDRHNRDMLINSDLLGVDGTAQLIEEVAGKVFQEQEVVNMEQKKTEFNKVFNAWDILVIAFGAMIGWGWVVSSGCWIQNQEFRKFIFIYCQYIIFVVSQYCPTYGKSIQGFDVGNFCFFGEIVICRCCNISVLVGVWIIKHFLFYFFIRGFFVFQIGQPFINECSFIDDDFDWFGFFPESLDVEYQIVVSGSQIGKYE